MKIKVPPHIESLVPYPPGKPLEELEREYGITGSIKLASNENPWGPSPKAVEAIAAALSGLHRYPDGSSYYLNHALAANLGVQSDEIVLGNGSNEIIDFLITAFMRPGEEVITSHPSFLMYQKFVQVQGGVNRVVELKEKCHDLDGIVAEINNKTRLIFLDNPNNPTGTYIGSGEFADFLAKVPEGVIVVLDEAYVDFVEPDERIDTFSYLHGDKPVVALRTFSKAYGLAGLRLGFGVMNSEIAGYLHRVRQPFNVNSLAQIGGVAALNDEEHYSMTLSRTKEQRAWLMQEVTRLGCSPMPSHTNFFLVDVGGSGKKLYEQMLYKGVIIRPMEAYGYPNYIRITIGTSEENQRFIGALSETLAELGYVR
jgi:histidinol-phosphate aminotransferase